MTQLLTDLRAVEALLSDPERKPRDAYAVVLAWSEVGGSTASLRALEKAFGAPDGRWQDLPEQRHV